MRDLVRPWTRLRDPRFTGHELPLPDFGLACRACRWLLTGAQRHACPHCGVPFDPEEYRPAGEWYVLDHEGCGGLLVSGVQPRLAAEYVPHMPMGEKALAEIYVGQSMTVTRLRVPTEFYFEVRWLIRQMLAEVARARMIGESQKWRCRNCREMNPGHFEICWNCEAGRSAQV